MSVHHDLILLLLFAVSLLFGCDNTFSQTNQQVPDLNNDTSIAVPPPDPELLQLLETQDRVFVDGSANVRELFITLYHTTSIRSLMITNGYAVTEDELVLIPRSVRILYLDIPGMTDQYLIPIMQLPDLKTVIIKHSHLSTKGVEGFRALRPDVDIRITR